MRHVFNPCADPLSCPPRYQNLCHEPTNYGGECDQPLEDPVHTTPAVLHVMAVFKNHIDMADYFFEAPDPDGGLPAYQAVLSYHGPDADDAGRSEEALARVTADVPLGLADFELTTSPSTGVPLLGVSLLDA
jgi:hypothetical protein